MLRVIIKRRTIIFWLLLSWIAIPMYAIKCISEKVLSGISWWINDCGKGYGASACVVACACIHSIEQCCQMSPSTPKCKKCLDFLFMLELLDNSHDRERLPFPLRINNHLRWAVHKKWQPSSGKGTSLGSHKVIGDSDTLFRSRQIYEDRVVNNV